MADFNGTPDGDYFEGTNDAELIDGAGGDDDLSGYGGNDTILGGTGNDTLYSDGGNSDVVMDGGEGSDNITGYTSGGSLNIAGGAGNFGDYISVNSYAELVENYDPETDTYTYQDVGGDVTIDGGDGGDTIRLYNNGVSATVLAGDGQDAVSLRGNGAVTVTTGAGSDKISIQATTFNGSNAVMITDFTTGVGGDQFDLTTVISRIAENGWSEGNPFGQGYLSLVQQGADVVLMIDWDGSANGGYAPIAAVVFQNTTLATFNAANFIPAMDPTGAPTPGQNLTGTPDYDSLSGGMGNDTINGDAGSDALEGNAGRDLINGGDGDDFIYGGSGNDSLNGQAGDDDMTAHEGDDLLDGGNGNDSLYGDDGNDTLLGGVGDDFISGSNGNDSIDGGDGNDYIYGGSGNGTLLGGAGNDGITGQTSGALSIEGGAGADSVDIEIYGGSATVSGDDGNDFIGVYAEATENYVYDPDSDTYNYVYVGGATTITGGAGNDTISVQNNNATSTVSAGDGDDLLRLRGAGNTVVTTGAGSDRIELSSLPFADGGVVVTDFTTGAGGDRFNLTAVLNEISNYGWTAGNPFGQDYLSLVQQGADVVLMLDRDAGGVDYDPIVLITFQNTTVSAFTDDNFIPAYHPDGSAPVGETVVGTAGNDSLLGQEFNDTLQGGAGDDTLDGAAGSDQVEGGAGNDLIHMGDGDTVSAGDGDDVINIVGGRGGEVTSGAGSDRIVVTGLSPNLPGGLVVTDFDANAGGDKIDLSPVYYTLDDMGVSWEPSAAWLIDNGKLVFNQVGDDTVVVLNWYDWSSDSNVSLPILTLRDVVATSLSASNFLPVAPLDLVGGSGGDLLTGEDGQDTLQGEAGNDTLLGNNGDDRLYGGDDEDSMDGGQGDDYLTGGFGNDTLLGQAGEDRLNGGSGKDLLDGGAGNDSLEDGYGNDTFLGGEGDDTIFVENDGEVDLLIDGGSGADSIDVFAWSSNSLDVAGGDGNDFVRLYGGVTRTVDLGAGNDTLRLSNEGTTTLTTGAGSDLIELTSVGFSDGNPLTITDFTPGVGGDRLNLDSALAYLSVDEFGGGNPFTNGYLVLEQLGANVVLKLDSDGTGTVFAPITLAIFQNTTVSAFTSENFVPAIDPAGGPIPGQLLNGTPDDDYLTGGLGGDTLNGQAGYDDLRGGYGHDSIDGGDDGDGLYGGGGNDTLLGQAGDDILDGGSGNDSLVGGIGDDEMRGNNGNDTLDGGDGADTIYGGNGDNALSGGLGNDQIYADGGRETLSGGDGDDNITKDSFSGTSFNIDGGAGNDTILAEIISDSDVTLLGGSGDDRVTIFNEAAMPSSSNTVTVDLGDGNDTLNYQPLGLVTVSTGAGSDLIDLNVYDLQDAGQSLVITDFTAGNGGDRLGLDAALLRIGTYGFTAGNPFAQGYLKLEQQGTDVVLKLDPDGAGTDFAPIILVTLRGTTVSAFTAANFVPAIDPAGGPIPGQLLNGTPDDESLSGGLGNDTLNGLDGYDELRGGFGHDSLDGGDGGDYLFGNAGNDTLLGQAGSDELDGGSGNDSLVGGADGDWLYGQNGDDTLDGGDGDDRLYAGNGNNSVSGGAGDDRIFSYGDNDTLLGGDGNDIISKEGSSQISFHIDGGAGNDQIEAEIHSSNTATIIGGAGEDNVRLVGGFSAFEDDDSSVVTVDLGAGNDTFSFDPVGSVTVTTGTGSDTIFLSVFDFGDTGQSLAITDFTAGAGGDRLELADVLNWLEGYGFEAGNPFAQGYLKLEQQGADVVLKLDLDGTGTNHTPVILVTLRDTTVSAFTAANFVPEIDPAGGPIPGLSLNGTPDDDNLFGGLGNDTLVGQAGYDELSGSFGHDSLDGGDDGDYLYGGGGNDTLLGQSGFDNLYGGAGGDSLFGGAEDDSIFTGAGNDSADGGTGDDRIYGGGGKDSLNGGDGADTIFLSGSDGGSINGGANDDVINANFNTGNLTVDGGSGNDSIDVTSNYQDDMSENPYTGGNLTVSGGLGDDIIRLDNNGDTTTVLAGDGNDIIKLNARPGTTVTTGAGADRVEISSFSTGTAAMVITDFTPGVGGDTLALDSVLSHLNYHGWLGGNPFGQGYLKLVQQGADVALMLDNDGTAAGFAQEALVIFRGTTVAAFRASNFDPAIDPAGVEFPNLLLTGTADADYLMGGVSNDTIIGNAGDDTLYGYYGNDSITGGDGDDEIFGDGGKNLLDGGAGNDWITADGLNDTVLGGVGADTIYSYASGDVSIDAGDGWNEVRVRIYGGSLNLTTGSDDDFASVRSYYDAVEGADVTVSMGGGDDYLHFQNYGDTANLSMGAGNDTVHAAGSGTTTLSLGSGVDELWLWGASDFNGAVSVTDFATGAGGDRVNLSNVMEQLEDIGAPAGDPFAQGYVYLVQRGSSAVLRADLDGAGSAYTPVDLVTFTNTLASSFTAANFIDGYQPVVASNLAPTVAHAIEDLTTDEDSPSGSFSLPLDTFIDANGDALTLSATLTSGAALPSWLTFTAATGTFSGQAPANFNGVLNIRVTATDGSASVSDDFKITFTPVNDAPTGGISVSGTATQGEVLSAVTSSLVDVDGLGSFSYQWLRAGAVITGATGSTYALTQADVGKGISLRLTYTDGGATAETVTSAATAAVQNVNDAPTGGISVSGTAKQGQVLSAVTSSLADLDGLGSFSYQWLRAGAVISGATGSTYALTQADVGKAISLRLTYTDDGSTAETVTSAATAAVQNVNDAPTGGISISGTAKQGEVLSAVTSSLADADGLGAFSYQWLRGGAVIAGATGSTYTLVQADVGTAISLRLTYTDGGATAETVISPVTAAVARGPINGTAASEAMAGTALGDTMNGLAGNDTIKGLAGDDWLFGDADKDFLYGGDNHDALTGGAGDDKLFGDAGNDTLFGGDNNDALTGGAGIDRMAGGAGKDSFVFQKFNDSTNAVATADLITDFVRGTDKINLSAMDASVSLANNNAFTWRGTSSFTTTNKGEVSYKKFDLAGTANDYTLVYLDNDSDKASEMVIKLTGLFNLTATDFIL